MVHVWLQRVVVYVGPSERSFYESLQDAAVPAQEALAAHAASLAPDSAAEAGPSSPREAAPLYRQGFIFISRV